MIQVLPAAVTILAAAAATPDAGWRPFLTPMPIWDYWFWLLVPLSIGVAFAYKATKTDDAHKIPGDAAILTVWILGGLLLAAAGIALVAHFA